MRSKLNKIYISFILIFTCAMGAMTLFDGNFLPLANAVVEEQADKNEPKTPYMLETPELSDDYELSEIYETEWPDFLIYDIQYDKYDVFPNYVVNLSSTRRKIYKEADTGAEYYGKLSYGEKLQVVAKVKDGDGELWYAVVYEYEDAPVIGYIEEDKVAKREFQLEKMNEYLQNVSTFHELGHIVYVKNYRNENGYPSVMPNGSYYDDFGYRRGQSIDGYFDSSMEGGFRYIPDGTLGIVEQVIEETKAAENTIAIDEKGVFTDIKAYSKYLDIDEEEPEEDDDEEDAVKKYNEGTEVKAVKLYIPSFDASVWVESKYLNEDEDAPDVLNQAIIVDRENQNIAVFEYDDGWKVISINYSSTGKVGQYSLPTPLGYYMAIEKKPKFDYVEDGTTTIVGFAPYAIRFSAGGYLHGVPMSYSFDKYGNKQSPSGYVEYLQSIGTVPKSHMCVRNYTSHAKFMYDWVDIGNCTVIVIE